MDSRPIGIFDSGLGGLTCVKEVMRVMPDEDIIYFGDTGRVPYGTKSADILVKYVRQDINFLQSFDVKTIIIACGTASSAALPRICSEYKTPLTGVLYPAALEAYTATKNGRIGVIGTPGTIASGKYRQQLLELDNSLKIFETACPMFVPLVENGYAEKEPTRIIAREYLKDIKEAEVDTLILGCTHYPHLKKVIREILGDGVRLIDSGAAAADYVKEELSKKGLLAEREKEGKAKYYVSDSVEGFAKLGGLFLNREIKETVEHVDIENY